MQKTTWPLLFTLLATFKALAAPPSGVIEVTARDSLTGQGLAATIQLLASDGAAPTRVWQARAGHQSRLQLPAGPQRLRIVATGHRPLETQFNIARGDAVRATIWLDPVNVPDELRPENVRQLATPGVAIIHGYVVDASTGTPLAGVTLRLKEQWARSDSRGYFALQIPALPGSSDSLPESADLMAERSGYKSLRLKNTLLPDGVTYLMVEMEPGTGSSEQDNTHKLSMPAEILKQSQLPSEEEAGLPPVWFPPKPELTAPFLAQVIPPPPSIRVGTSCSCRNCTSVSTMSLETYVKRGLKDEWIASWSAHSLRAGAIAYRAYGSYHVYHPISANYDICDNACCQVNRAGGTAATDSAVAYTTGILLQRGGEIFRAEYSAENNNFNCSASSCSNASCLCGDGSAGSPGASWPCVSEPFDSGHTCMGHGRGMCQWGTQRAALQGQLWSSIEDHYYNNNGNPSGLRSAFMTSPLDITNAYPDPAVVSAGDTLTLYYSTLNYAEQPHGQVLLGASLFSSDTGYISDSANDAEVSLLPGSNDVSRWFAVSAAAPPGTYDLIVALWIDVDEDFVITSADLPLVAYTFPAAVIVQ